MFVAFSEQKDRRKKPTQQHSPAIEDRCCVASTGFWSSGLSRSEKRSQTLVTCRIVEKPLCFRTRNLSNVLARAVAAVVAPSTKLNAEPRVAAQTGRHARTLHSNAADLVLSPHVFTTHSATKGRPKRSFRAWSLNRVLKEVFERGPFEQSYSTRFSSVVPLSRVILRDFRAWSL